MRPHRLADPGGQLAHLRIVSGDAPAGAYLELRYRLTGGGMAAEFHRVADRHRLLQSVNRRAADTDVYVGCAPRVRPEGRKDAIEQVWTLWAECDGQESAQAARRFVPKPSLVIASGSGGNVHAYWALRHPVQPPDAEKANLRLASALGADLACFDASRILRPPGTWNHKHRPAQPVHVVDHRLAVRFDLDEVIGALPHVDLDQVERRWRAAPEARARRDPLLSLPPALYVGRLLGVHAAAGRKVRCPFHEDLRPSLHLYRTGERGWCCFSCRRGGTIYDLAAALWGMGTRGRDFVRLRDRLTEQFALDLVRVDLQRTRDLSR